MVNCFKYMVLPAWHLSGSRSSRHALYDNSIELYTVDWLFYRESMQQRGTKCIKQSAKNDANAGKAVILT